MTYRAGRCLDDKGLTLFASEFGNTCFVLIYREITESRADLRA